MPTWKTIEASDKAAEAFGVWQPDQATIAAALETIDRCADSTPDKRIAIAAIEGAGTLVLLDRAFLVRECIDRLQPAQSRLKEALQGLGPENLDRALTRLLEKLPLLDDDFDEGVLDEIVAAITVRDHYALVLEGAHAILGPDTELSPETNAAIEVFDEVMSTELWRSLPLGERRMQQVVWVSPRLRSRLWWWSKGASLPPGSWDALKQAALVLAEFPEAMPDFQHQIESEREVSELLLGGPERKNT
jgi:hypothetical protein